MQNVLLNPHGSGTTLAPSLIVENLLPQDFGCTQQCYVCVDCEIIIFVSIDTHTLACREVCVGNEAAYVDVVRSC